MLNNKPCQRKIASTAGGLSQLRGLTRKIWQLYHTSKENGFMRLRLALYVNEECLTGMSWDQLLWYVEESTMFGVDIQYLYEEWCTKNNDLEQHPFRLLLRLAHQPNVTKDAILHCIACLSEEKCSILRRITYDALRNAGSKITLKPNSKSALAIQFFGQSEDVYL